MNGLLWSVCILCLTTLGMMFILKKFNQPYLIAYIMVGIILGPHISGGFHRSRTDGNNRGDRNSAAHVFPGNGNQCSR
ncbi:hypothetical protein [Chryseobacterium sp. POE27]|uniref:hypothetical protein n=1 Tax=Chryseobacterium sp. POE27 TaxID=3138177 RepID=UPI00321997F0